MNSLARHGHGQPYVGRFAPSPTGELHFGSLIAALGSWLQARSHGGRWLVRIENIDPPREVPGSAERQLKELARFGLVPDEPPLRQSDRLSAHRQAAQRLRAEGHAFDCGCSRSELPAAAPYPGTCRAGLPTGREARSVRIRVPDRELRFQDEVHGRQGENLSNTCGDFVIWRADDLPAYQLAVVIDDAFQGVTEVVRGADLLDSTPRQLWLQELLRLPRPSYLHLPLVRQADGRKLSKRTGSDPLSSLPAAQALRTALAFLGQRPPAGTRTIDGLLSWAVSNWRAELIPTEAPDPADSGTQALY
jgi:glutamyl-Q tRNA(Asp) synthetase